ncbi:MAG: hypothetical protein BGO55_25740 [Sphingobacteriales bacterium 50-39]|nr:FAD-dependent oxidoreductase [Sphingobacteriales bacterium]OJW56307.1 MAG: hypothetical protein BGO55_25740 [Sphingobacteriales bacterium 50-39]
MPHSPLTILLQKAFAAAVRPEGTEQHAGASRRRFLKNSAFAAGSLLIPPMLGRRWPGAPASGDASRVAIVGAGIAGLNAAWQLKQQDITSTVYEASGRVGGRMYTIKDHFGQGLTTDLGGEFVDTTHTEILQLVKQLGLDLYDLQTDTLTPKSFWFDGRPLTEKDLSEAIRPFAERIMKDIHSLPPLISYQSAATFRHLDELSIMDYLRGIGIGGWLLSFLNVVLTREYGMEASEQSAINFLIMFEPPAATGGRYELFGSDHEVLKIRGGSQRLTDALYRQVQDQVLLRHKLTAIHPGGGGGGGYRLSFDKDGEKIVVHADRIILAIPFTILRNIPLQVAMPEEKQKCIREIGYGNSCKFIMGAREKAWRKAGRQGYTFTDLSFGCGWDSSQLQSEQEGSFTVFAGGSFGDYIKDSKEEDLAGRFLPALDTIYPGAQHAYSGKNIKYCWAGNPYNKAGYASFKKGQWSTLAGWEAKPVGNIYFAGEHVSRDFQGYMNGAAQTGRMAAEAVARSYKNIIVTHE